MCYVVTHTYWTKCNCNCILRVLGFYASGFVMMVISLDRFVMFITTLNLYKYVTQVVCCNPPDFPQVHQTEDQGDVVAGLELGLHLLSATGSTLNSSDSTKACLELSIPCQNASSDSSLLPVHHYWELFITDNGSYKLVLINIFH